MFTVFGDFVFSHDAGELVKSAPRNVSIVKTLLLGLFGTLKETAI
jgi:hypothetical protein